MQTLQWIYSAEVPAASTLDLRGVSNAAWCTEQFPYLVPPECWIGICDIHLSSKGGGLGRNSYLVVAGVGCATDLFPARFRVPIVVPPGAELNASLINNEDFPQWMTATVTAILVGAPNTANWRDVMTPFVGGSGAA